MFLFILVSVISLAVLTYFAIFGLYNYVYSFASLLKPKIKKASFSEDSKIAVVIVSYNEKNVILDTIKACEKLSYKNVTIILGDDSSDPETLDLIMNFVRERNGVLVQGTNYIDHENSEVYECGNFVLFHRRKNVGFKAGNLKSLERYLVEKKYDFMYLLDSDWHPQVDTIERCLEAIEADPNIAFVQTKRLSYYGKHDHFQRCLAINEEACYFTDLPGRQNLGDMILFSGCCTLFRLPYLYEVGGFQTGHLTEDIDLTNRFYLAGYKGVYLENVQNIGEVPPNYKAFRKQQERWAMGSARTFLHYLKDILLSKKMSFMTKCGLLRQNAYFTSSIPTELAILCAVAFTLIASFKSALGLDAVFASPAFEVVKNVVTPVMVLSIFSTIVPLIISSIKKKSYLNLLYIPAAFWVSLSIVHTYFIANIKGFMNYSQTWYLTPKTNRKKEKVKVKGEWKIRILNIVTLFLLMYTYSLNFQNYADAISLSLLLLYTISWVPSLVLGIVKS